MKDARHEPSRDAVREDVAETVHKFMRPEPVLELEVEGIPRRRTCLFGSQSCKSSSQLLRAARVY